MVADRGRRRISGPDGGTSDRKRPDEAGTDISIGLQKLDGTGFHIVIGSHDPELALTERLRNDLVLTQDLHLPADIVQYCLVLPNGVVPDGDHRIG